MPEAAEQTPGAERRGGNYVTIARKQLGKQDWYLGAVGDEEARTATVKLDCLTAGRSYQAQIYRDGDDADYQTSAQSLRGCRVICTMLVHPACVRDLCESEHKRTA